MRQEDCPHCNECNHYALLKAKLAAEEADHDGTRSNWEERSVELLEAEKQIAELHTELAVTHAHGREIGMAAERARIVKHLRDVADCCYGEDAKKALRDEAAIIEDSARP